MPVEDSVAQWLEHAIADRGVSCSNHDRVYVRSTVALNFSKVYIASIERLPITLRAVERGYRPTASGAL